MKMKAAAFAEFGTADVLRTTELDAPQAGPGQVRVNVKAAGVMPYDPAVRAGWTPAGYTMNFPEIPGNEFAGVIDEIGEGVTGFAVGDEVLGFSMLKCYAEYLAVGADQIVRKPAGMTWEAAGGFPGNAQGAALAMEVLAVGEGDTLLIHGASGGLGTLTIQLAKRLGAAAVIATASEPNHEYLRSLGAIPVAYGEGVVDRVRAAAPQGVDAALDLAGEEALRASVELVEDRKRIGTMVAYHLHEELGVQVVRGERTAERLAGMVERYDRGELTVHLREVYPLDRAADAHRDVESGHGRGKVVISIG
ncbi:MULTISPECIES: NADP-dependent oxidoreductase [unclassified Streptomyces]|uniref:NADP-dependent oxidoreductase n=1 Tax=unclassified Streptomyces TaxID=2593676 RepID=UPI002DDBC14C|nr:NADP-dependent oxidoreductase [Streptomyces sp. NBC_01237]